MMLSGNNNPQNTIDCALKASYTNCADAIGRFVTNRYNCYNQVLPSVVTTRMGQGNEETQRGKNMYGITYLPQLFYVRGINMGASNEWKGDVYSELTPTSTAEKCTEYINYPGQLASYSTTDRNSYNGKYKNSWTVANALTAAFNFANGKDAADAFTTNQAQYLPTHYPLYRGFATFNTSIQATFETASCVKAAGLKYKALDNAAMTTLVNTIKTNITNAQSLNYETYFVYTHSAKPEHANSFYKACELTYESSDLADVYGTSAHNFYSISNTAMLNSTARYLTDENGVVNDVNILDYGFIPRHADIVSLLGSEADQRKITFNAISASDIKHMLLIDDNKRPILDVALDAEVFNNGYTINFNAMHKVESYTTDSVLISAHDNKTTLICKSNKYGKDASSDAYAVNQQLVISATSKDAFSGPSDSKYKTWFDDVKADHLLLNSITYSIESISTIPNSNLYAITLNKALTRNSMPDRTNFADLAVYNYDKSNKTSTKGRNMHVMKDTTGIILRVE